MSGTGQNNNPTGKGGFVDNPQNIIKDRPDYWEKMTTILQRLSNMDPDDLEAYKPKTSKEALVKRMVIEGDYKEVFNRIDGKVPDKVEHMGKDGEAIENKVLIEFVDAVSKED
jgi:hypothetical protein